MGHNLIDLGWISWESKEKYRRKWKRDVNRPSTTVNIQKSRKFIKGVKGSVS